LAVLAIWKSRMTPEFKALESSIAILGGFLEYGNSRKNW